MTTPVACDLSISLQDDALGGWQGANLPGAGARCEAALRMALARGELHPAEAMPLILALRRTYDPGSKGEQW